MTKGREGMMASSYDARVKAVSAMVERAGAKLGSVDYLQGPFDVIADAEVDSYETASWASSSDDGFWRLG